DGKPLEAAGTDGQMHQVRTNFRAARITPGHHVLEIKGDVRFADWKQEFDLAPATIPKIHAAMSPAAGAAAVARPSEVRPSASSSPAASARAAPSPPPVAVARAEKPKPGRPEKSPEREHVSSTSSSRGSRHPPRGAASGEGSAALDE